MRRRWWLLLLFLPIYTAMLAWLGTVIVVGLGFGGTWNDFVSSLTPQQWIDVLDDREWWMVIGVPVLILVATQSLFLLPMWSCNLSRKQGGTSLRFSIVMAATVAAALTLALAFAAWNFLLWVLYQIGSMAELEVGIDLRDEHLWPVIFFVLGSWLFWSIVFLAFAGRNAERWAGGRLLGLLLGGTILEVMIVLPLDIMVRRKTDCYCSTGTFLSLCLSIWALLWLAGPGAVIAVMSRRRRTWWETHCAECGYEKGPSPGDKCPECGFEWRAIIVAKPQAASTDL